MDQLPFFEPPEERSNADNTNFRDFELAELGILNSLKYQYRLSNSQIIRLVTYFKTLDALKSAGSIELQSVGKCGKSDFSELGNLPIHEYQNLNIVSYFDDHYPPGLRDLNDSPVFLWYRGKLPTTEAISIVGTRKSDARSNAIASKVAEIASKKDVAVVSGLALGIDTKAHEGCLSTNGTTVAILACDVRSPSPTQNRDLAEQILESGGCLVSEMPPGSSTNAGQLIARNRLQAAWSKSLVVVQSGIPSGTLHTVRNALQLKRKLIVVAPPENSFVSGYEGNLQLIDPLQFDVRILGGSIEFQNRIEKNKMVADYVIRSESDFEKTLSDIYD